MVMVTAQVESFKAALEELKPLLERHWRELALYQDDIPLAPDYPWYFEREALGELLFVTVRKNGKIIAYYIGFVGINKHYTTSLQCKLDIWRVVEEERGRMYERRLFRAVKAELERRGVQLWWNGEKEHQPCGRLYEAFGMEKVETYYAVKLGT